MLTNFLKGRGLRERVLRRIGSSDLYDRLIALESERNEFERLLTCERTEEVERRSIPPPDILPDDIELRSRLDYFMSLHSADRLIELDYPVTPRVRYGWEMPPHPVLQFLLSANEERFEDHIRSFLPFRDTIMAIPAQTARRDEPHWANDWFPAFDAISLYCFLAIRRPRRFIEIGSGNSTKFARRAIEDHSLKTTIVSIDPFPRSEIDAICDKVVRLPLEQLPRQFFDEVSSDDILFFDGSHRVFQSSDATIFFTEVIPNLMNNTMVGVHDIFLPHDYPAHWLNRYYSEQYLLASWLLGGSHLRVELPVFYSTRTRHLHGLLGDFWKLRPLSGVHQGGGIFWFTTQIH